MIDFITTFIIVWVFCIENCSSIYSPLSICFSRNDTIKWVCCKSKHILEIFSEDLAGIFAPSKLSSTVTPGLCSVSNQLTSVMVYHRGASLSEQHTDLLCTKQDLSHTRSRFVDESSPKIARYRIRMPTARTATLNVNTYA